MACDDQGSNSVVTDLGLFVAPTATALLKIAKGVKGGISVMAPEDQTEQPDEVKNHGWDDGERPGLWDDG